MLVSVVIPNHNGARFLAECLESVFSQSYKDLEIIVVDDHSTDNSLEILKGYGEIIRMVVSEDFGASSTRNAGMLSSRGDLIALLDCDDLWEPDKISKQVDLLQNSEAGLIYCPGIEFDASGNTIATHHARNSGDCYSLFEKNPGVAVIALGCSTAIFRKSLLNEAGLFDPKFSGPAEDWDFFRRLCRITTINYVDEILVKYRRHNANISGRGIVDFKFGNELAIRKLIKEDSGLSDLRARICWAKLQIMIIKSSLKELKISLAFKSAMSALMGPNY
jgi:glycosyltransferase involved in cell wall biosynthesis